MLFFFANETLLCHPSLSCALAYLLRGLLSMSYTHLAIIHQRKSSTVMLMEWRIRCSPGQAACGVESSVPFIFIFFRRPFSRAASPPSLVAAVGCARRRRTPAAPSPPSPPPTRATPP